MSIYLHIAEPVGPQSKFGMDATLCGKDLGRTAWMCFEGDGNYGSADCPACIKEAYLRRVASAMARDRIAEARGEQ